MTILDLAVLEKGHHISMGRYKCDRNVILLYFITYLRGNVSLSEGQRYHE